MTPQEQTPKATINQDELAHSGDLGLEQPVIDLDKSLKDAHKDGLVTVPSNVDQGFEAEKRIQAERAKREAGQNKFLAFLKKPIGKAAVTGAGLSLAAAGVVVANNQSSGAPHEAQPSATSAPVPGETQAPVETKPAESPLASPTNLGPLETAKPIETNGIEIKAGLSNEQLGEALIDRLSDWGMAGATKDVDENQLTGDNLTLTLEQYVDKVVNERHAKFVAELLPKDYAADPALKQFADGMKEDMRTNTSRYLQTTGGTSLNPKNKEAWNQTAVFEGVTYADKSGANRVLVANFTEQNNADKNLFGNGVPTIPGKAKANFTVTEADGSVVITSALLQSR